MSETKQVCTALAARLERISIDNGYATDITGVHEQVWKFDPDVYDFPLVSVVYVGGDYTSLGPAARYFENNGHIELIGVIKSGTEDRIKPLDLLEDIKRAAFEPNASDAIDNLLASMSPVSDAILVAQPGEAYTQVTLIVRPVWCDDAVSFD